MKSADLGRFRWISRLSSLAAACAVPLAGCGGSPARAIAGDAPTVGEAFGVRCDAVRAQEAPDLMAWDAASRANLGRLRQRGVVAVRYESRGCEVKLELLPNCKGPSSYRFSPTSARETKSAKDASEVFASLPLGAHAVAGKVGAGRSLRTDLILVGTDALGADARVQRASLRGQDCPRATHVVSTVYLGGFAMEAGTSAELAARASVFGVEAGGASSASSERLAREGDPAACEEALKSGKEHPLCAVPLRVGLLALDGLASDGSGVAAAGPTTTAPPPACPAGMAPVPGGTYGHGRHAVTVGPFCMDKTEVTASAYSACVDAGKCAAPAETKNAFCNYRKAGREGHPINCVSLDDAKRVCQSRGLLVPTEQQWVWAARGNAQRAFPWGEDEEAGRACSDRAKEGTCEVGAHPRGATPEGVLGLVGNVSELVESGVNGTRAMGGDYRKAVKDLHPYSGRSADSAPEIGVRCVTR
ncbi:MAG TPA: SUMF1/EgtB/PvdO family nonheme iron enzyme [Polyangiaceae bacterium]|nr:SUMF1/EgtB/PvdO family nonheme iron enzyme [Polyangiaceae bacterium]